MDMRINGASMQWALQNQSSTNGQQQQSGLQTVLSDLSAGDLSGAQAAFNQLNINTSNQNPNSALGKLAAALQSGDLTGAQSAAQSVGHHHHHHHGGGSSTSGVNQSQAVTPSSLVEMIAGSLENTFNQSQTNSSLNGSDAADTTVTNATSPTQALAGFLQNLMLALNSQVSSPLSSNSSSQTLGANDSSIQATSATTAVSTTSFVLQNQGVQGQDSPAFQNYLQAVGGQMQSNVTGLLQALSTTSSGITANSSLDALNSSFNQLAQSLGTASGNVTLTSFLQNLQTSLQASGTSGNLLNFFA